MADVIDRRKPVLFDGEAIGRAFTLAEAYECAGRKMAEKKMISVVEGPDAFHVTVQRKD